MCLSASLVRGLVEAASPQFLVPAVACRTRSVRNDGLSVPSVVVACDSSFLVRDPCYSPSCPDAVVALGFDCGVSALFVRGLVGGGVSASSCLWTLLHRVSLAVVAGWRRFPAVVGRVGPHLWSVLSGVKVTPTAPCIRLRRTDYLTDFVTL